MGKIHTNVVLILIIAINIIDFLQLCDKINSGTLISIIGNIVMVFTFTFLGPAPFLNISTSVALIDGILALGGVGYAFVMVSTFSRAQSEVLKKGFSDEY